MDVPRSRAKPRLRRIVLVIGAVGALAAATLVIRWLSTRAPSVSRDQLYIAKVSKSPLTLEVRGNGTFVPIDFRWASAPTAARVDKVLVQPGTAVEATTVLLVLANPDAELAALNADRDVAAAEAELARLAATLDGTRLAQESAVAGLDADVVMANRRSTIDTSMAEKGVIPDLESKESVDRAKQLGGRRDFEKKRLTALNRGNAAQLEAQHAQVERLRALAQFQHRQLEALHVVAGQAGVVQQVAVEAGQSVTAGAPLAKIVVPERLKARLKIPESSTEDVALGLHASIDTRSGIVKGEVIRIDPAAQNGSVTVDVSVTDPLPKSARPDQNVDGVIELEKTGDVLHIARPAVGEAHASASLFKIEGDKAVRVKVKFGRAALKDIEIASGLSDGDEVILSDMSRWDNVDVLRVE
ncbi:MAG TPA: HlyD family efflux transporter periplasmic adaptor subunit [Kofleriaceae bacterium]|nr:HlyD family efflux transporter periplasmic adaptor subunit [Kofleriaceae bacterium]